MISKTKSSCIFLFANDYRTVTSGGARGTGVQEVRPGAGFETGDFIKEV